MTAIVNTTLALAVVAYLVTTGALMALAGGSGFEADTQARLGRIRLLMATPVALFALLGLLLPSRDASTTLSAMSLGTGLLALTFAIQLSLVEV